MPNGTIVEDVMKKHALDCTYEHPVHSIILDINDSVWKKYFSEEELEKISTCNRKNMPLFSGDHVRCFDVFDNIQEAEEIYKIACKQGFDPVEDHTKKWIFQSIMNAIALFFYQSTLDVSNYSEAKL